MGLGIPRHRTPIGSPAAVVLAGVALVACATSVGALLADLYRVVPMARFGRFVTLPGLVVLIAIAVVPVPRLTELQRRIRVGAVAGVVGTLAYDLVRIPFAMAGQRIFAPISSYGLLLADASMSSPTTETLGWLFHLSNGVTFGIAYAVVAARWHWGWGVAWGLGLETAAFLSPFTGRYALTGNLLAIGIAYGAHVFYGFPVGRIVQRLDHADAWLSDRLRSPGAAAVGAGVLVILLWQQPWAVPPQVREAQAVSAAIGRPVAAVAVDRFRPEWLRIRAGQCIRLVSRSDQAFSGPYGDLPPGGDADWCFERPGTFRVRLGDRPYSGGFVYVEYP